MKASKNSFFFTSTHLSLYIRFTKIFENIALNILMILFIDIYIDIKSLIIIPMILM